MKEITPKALEHSAAALTTAMGTTTAAGSFFGFLNDNAPGIGVLLTFTFGCVATGFHIYNSRQQRKDSDEIEELRKTIREIGKRESDKGKN